MTTLVDRPVDVDLRFYTSDKVKEFVLVKDISNTLWTVERRLSSGLRFTSGVSETGS